MRLTIEIGGDAILRTETAAGRVEILPLRVVCCGQCGLDPRHPCARACTSSVCPHAHDRASLTAGGARS